MIIKFSLKYDFEEYTHFIETKKCNSLNFVNCEFDKNDLIAVVSYDS